MKNKDLFTLNAAIQELSDVKGKEFAYAIFKNKLIDGRINNHIIWN